MKYSIGSPSYTKEHQGSLLIKLCPCLGTNVSISSTAISQSDFQFPRPLAVCDCVWIIVRWKLAHYPELPDGSTHGHYNVRDTRNQSKSSGCVSFLIS